MLQLLGHIVRWISSLAIKIKQKNISVLKYFNNYTLGIEIVKLHLFACGIHTEQAGQISTSRKLTSFTNSLLKNSSFY